MHGYIPKNEEMIDLGSEEANKIIQNPAGTFGTLI